MKELDLVTLVRDADAKLYLAQDLLTRTAPPDAETSRELIQYLSRMGGTHGRVLAILEAVQAALGVQDNG